MNNLYTITRINGGVIAWTEEQVAYIIDKYVNKNYTLKQLGREFNCNYGTIRNLLNKHHIKTRGNKQGYPRDEFYFNKIDTQEKAYWLGFLYADGYIHNLNNAISIDIIDLEHIKKFQKAIKANNHKIIETKDNRFKNAKPLYHFSIKDEQLHKDLIKWGCVPQKSLILEKIPNIPRDFVSDFIRGYFDGDGSIHYLQGTNNFRISFLGTESFLNDVQKELQTNVSLQHPPAIGKAYCLQVGGRKQVVRILDYLYKNSNESIRLNRKYQKYLECLDWARRH